MDVRATCDEIASARRELLALVEIANASRCGVAGDPDEDRPTDLQCLDDGDDEADGD